MPKRTKEPSAYPRVDNKQKFSSLRLIPMINQKNYFTNYLKKESQYLGHKIRERPENDETKTVVVQIGSQSLKIGFSDDTEPQRLPFCLAKPQQYYSSGQDDVSEEQIDRLTESFEQGLADVKQSFVDRMKFYKTRIIHNSKEICRDFNKRQKGTEIIDDSEAKIEDTTKSIYCRTTAFPATHRLFWPIVRGVLNEDPHYYRSAQELINDIYEILNYAVTQHLGITDLAAGGYDVVVVAPDLLSRTTLTLFVDLLFQIGFANLAVIQESVAATYGAGISAACVVDIGAQTTTVSCVDDGACIANSRVKLDFGGRDITEAFGKLLKTIDFPGNPDLGTLEQLKQKFVTVNEADISVQLYQYSFQGRKYDFKIYNEVMLPVLGLFYPNLFSIPPNNSWRFTLFPMSMDPYTGHTNEPLSDADINIKMGTLAVFGQSYKDLAVTDISTQNDDKTDEKSESKNGDDPNDDGDAIMLDVGDDDPDASREGSPALDANGSTKDATNKESLSQATAYEALDPTQTALIALDHAIIESIKQAELYSGTSKLYYENVLVIGGGSKIPSFHALLVDRLVMWNQSRLKEIGEVSVLAMTKDMEPEFMSWRGGSVYCKLKVIDEMWTTRSEWNTLGARALHYKAALYIF